MNAQTDQQLLRDYAGNHSEAAFAELVRRHVNLVYSAALRMVCDSHQAEDVTQNVFVALSQNSRHLTEHPVLTGWLHRTTQNLAANAVRTNVRRQMREQEAVVMNELISGESDATWEHIGPHLDAALGELSEADRDAVLLRYFEKKSAQEMAEHLGISTEAAQKRVSRAVERLREFFSKRGVTVGASGLAVVISTNAVQAAPMGLALTISTAALTGTTLATTTTVTATKAIAMTALQKTIVTATIAVLAGAGIYEARQASQLRDQVQALQQERAPLVEQIQQLQRERDDAMQRLVSLSPQPAPHLPGPRMQPASPTTSDLQSTNLYARFKGEQPRLSVEQLEPYLKANGRNAASLLAAYRTTGDSTLLEEAMQKYPNNPQVAFEAAMSRKATPEERRQWLEALKKSDPNNALANYLSALDYFKSGQTDQAVQEFTTASGKVFQDFTSERYQDDTEAYLASGHSVAEAKTSAGMQLLLPQLAQVKELGLNMIELAKSYRQAGDDTSAQATLRMAINLAQRYSTPSPGEPTVSQLVGIQIEGIALKAMDANAIYGNSGQTVQDRLNQLTQQRAEVEERNRQAESVFPKMTEQDWINYRDRWLMFGEENAIKWVVNKYGQQ